MKFYVTTSIPYVNGSPHIGHAYELILADVLARHARAQGKDTIFSTGTDEHGGKIDEKATQLGVTPKELADKISKEFSDLTKTLDISNDVFIRTTDENHEKRAQAVWLSLKDDIYKGNYVGWYCTGDEAFVPEATVRANNGICPTHNRPYEKVEEENYFFKLSKYTEKIKNLIESDKLKIIPETRRNEILSVIREGLDDTSISRPKSKIAWGIGVPGDEDQVMYVWFEALLNYITLLNYPEGEEFKKFWPADYQVIGKDIIRFHTATWPGILLSLGIDLPEVVYVHGFININNQKMSKSTGNYLEPKEVVDYYGVDPFRYYVLRHIPSYDDGDFSWQKLHDAYQNELGNELGNAVQRTAVMVSNYLDGKVDVDRLNSADKVIDELVAKCQFDRALDKIWEKIKALNQYIDDEKPWELHKQKDEKLVEVLTSQVNQLIAIAGVLSPFLPETSEKIFKIFKAGSIKIPEKTLFPRLDEKAQQVK